jgi:hypothetical protein
MVYLRAKIDSPVAVHSGSTGATLPVESTSVAVNGCTWPGCSIALPPMGMLETEYTPCGLVVKVQVYQTFVLCRKQAKRSQG